MTKTQIALEYIRLDYAENGKDTGIAMRHYCSNKISFKSYQEAAKKGLEQFKQKPRVETQGVTKTNCL